MAGAAPGSVGELVHRRREGGAGRERAVAHGHGDLVRRRALRVRRCVRGQLPVPVHLHVGGGYASEGHLGRGAEVVALNGHRGAGTRVRGRGGQNLHHVRGRGGQGDRGGVDHGVGRIGLVGEDLGVLTGRRVGVPHHRRLAADARPVAEDVVPVTPAAAVGRRRAVEVRAAVPVVVHPGEIRPEGGFVLGENGPAGALEARRQRAGVRAGLCAGQCDAVQLAVEAGVHERQPTVAALLVGEDEQLHGGRVGRVVERQHERAEALERAGVIDVVQNRIDASRGVVAHRGAGRHDLRRHAGRWVVRREDRRCSRVEGCAADDDERGSDTRGQGERRRAPSMSALSAHRVCAVSRFRSPPS